MIITAHRGSSRHHIMALGVLVGLLCFGWLIVPPRAAAAGAFAPFGFHSHRLIRVPASPGRSPSSQGPAESPEADQGTISENWSGYALTGSAGSSTSITGCWTVPSVSRPSSGGDTFSSAWIGIDGFDNQYLIQTGTEQDWYDGAAEYLAWWEILTPSSTPPATEIGVVNHGDTMCASILEEAGGTWTISISDETMDEEFSTAQPYVGPGESAEWILEAPYVCDPSCGSSTLANYGLATFDGTVNGRDPGLTSSESVAMVQGNPPVRVSTPSNPNTQDDGFSVAYGASQPSPPPSPTPPAVDSVSPDLGSSGGGRTVTISGGGFASGAMVEFGSNQGTGVTVTSSSELTAVTPPGTGAVAVTVTNLNGGATSDPSAYTYSQDVEAAVRGVGGGSWVLAGLDSMSPVLTGSWSEQGGGILESPAVVSVPNSSGAGTPLYVATGVDHNVWVSLEGGPWGRLSASPVDCTDAPAATVVAATPASTGAYKLVVACRGVDGALWWVSGAVTSGSLPSGFSGWASLGGLIESGTSGGPAVAADEPPSGTPISFDSELTFFVNGMDGRVWATTAATGAGRWTPLGWACSGHLAAAASVVSGTLTTAFACQGADQALLAAITTGSGWDLQRVGGTLVDGPGIALSTVSWTVVVEGVDGALWQDTSTSTAGGFSFGGWRSEGGELTNGAAATALLTEATTP